MTTNLMLILMYNSLERGFRESNHMTSSKVCKKVAENWTWYGFIVALNGKHVTI